MKGKTGWGTWLTSVLTALAFTSGCIMQPEPQVARTPPQRAPGADLDQERHESGELKAQLTQVTDGVDVNVAEPAECRDRKPMEAEIQTKRTANFYEQAANASGFLLFGGIGAYYLGAPCNTTPSATAADPNPSSQPCTSDQKTQTAAIAGGLIGLGALFGAAFIYNVIRARDTTDVVEIPPEWRACDPRPLANASVRLVLGDQQLDASTDASGHAHFAPIYWLPDNLGSGSADLVIRDTNQHIPVSLTSLPAYVNWRRREDAAAASAARQAAQAPAVDTHQCELTCNDRSNQCIGACDGNGSDMCINCMTTFSVCASQCRGISNGAISAHIQACRNMCGRDERCLLRCLVAPFSQ